jgi:DNA invertase Pin-like site-specific DNA recombinase
MERPKSPIRRCAIYTLKSSEEGLEQDFNSLNAQREACEAFIKSQAGEGWRLVKSAYDDGGLSGATMERPALQRLLSDINQGLIDVVVVYKVAPLTRRGVGCQILSSGTSFSLRRWSTPKLPSARIGPEGRHHRLRGLRRD